MKNIDLEKRILFISDPWESLDHKRDSSLHLASSLKDFESSKRKFRVFFTSPKHISMINGRVFAQLEYEWKNGKKIDFKQKTSALLSEFHSIHWRVDPPVDINTIQLWNILSLETTPIFNCPFALLKLNEKLAPFFFEANKIPSLVTSSKEEALAFIKFYNQANLFILKPLHQAASRGITLLSKEDPEFSKKIDHVQNFSSSFFMIQIYDHTIHQSGETRLFLINGKVCGSLKKSFPIGNITKPQILNFDNKDKNSRPSLSLVKPTKVQLSQTNEIGKILIDQNITLATVDWIDDQVLEINVTSPGLIKWYDENKPKTTKSLSFQYWNTVLKSNLK